MDRFVDPLVPLSFASVLKTRGTDEPRTGSAFLFGSSFSCVGLRSERALSFSEGLQLPLARLPCTRPCLTSCAYLLVGTSMEGE